MSVSNRPTRRSQSASPRKATASRAITCRRTKAAQATSPALLKRAARLLDAEIDFIPNDGFVGQRDRFAESSELVQRVEKGLEGNAASPASGLPAHLGRLCATPLLSAEEEKELFERMNYCKYRAHALASRLSRSRPALDKVREAESCLIRAERLRNYLIQANTRLVMSIARKFADARNGFDDLLSQGIASLMHAVEKFDFSRGYRFSTYATCAVRRDLYRLVMKQKQSLQRFATGSGELLDGCAEDEADPDELTESSWRHLSTALVKMLERLDERERFIITYRFGLDETGNRSSYSRLGERLGISKERVRQLANRALDKLREHAPEFRLEALVS
ncbi:RNA polymerase sigma factor SigB [Planctomycetes bacterium MalM25]|nr:RNA polymerase sigma factor SigB [Planctomycetes bacterium MalM25]